MVPSPELLVSVPVASLIADAGPDLGRAAGRFHPLVVHFPIALGLVAVGVEWWRSLSRRDGLSPLTLPLLWIAAVSAVASAGSGWINAACERANDTGDTLNMHRWLGTLTALAFVGLAVWCQKLVKQSAANPAKAAAALGGFRWAALVGAVAMGFSGHLGGDLVHGEGYLTECLMPGAAAQEEDAVDAPAAAQTVALNANERFFVEKVRPILQNHCFECHGPKKQKGGLRMDSKAWLFNGPEEKWSVLPGKAGDSLLVHRIELNRVDPDAMPPEGDGLSSDEKAVVRKWIDDGAAYPAVAAAAGGGGKSDGAAASSGGGEPSPAARAKAEAASKALIARGVLVQPLAADSPLFDVNASRAEPVIGDADAALFADIAPLVANLNLAKSALTDAGLAKLGSMPKLERLRLDGTAIGDAGLGALGSLPSLESINLIGTKVTGASVAWLTAQPALRRVYVWQTAVDTPDTMKALNAGGKLQAIGADLPLAQPKGPPMPEDPKPDAPKPDAKPAEEKKPT